MQGHWSTTFDKLDETGAITESLPIWPTTDYSQRQRQFAQLREKISSPAFHKTWAASIFQARRQDISAGPGCVPSCL